MIPKKKGLRRRLKCFSSASLFRGSWCYIRPDFEGLFPLINQRSNLDGGTPKSRWGDAQSRWGTLHQSRDAPPPHPPYNLSTDYNTKTPQLSTLKGLFLPTYSDYRIHAQQQ